MTARRVRSAIAWFHMTRSDWIGTIIIAVILLGVGIAIGAVPALHNLVSPPAQSVSSLNGVDTINGIDEGPQSAPAKPKHFNPTSSDLCAGLLNSGAVDFMGSSMGTPDAFDTGCHYVGASNSSVNLLYYPGTQQFGTDYFIAKADFGRVHRLNNVAGSPRVFYAAAHMPQGYWSVVIEWVTPGQTGDFQLRIAWQGDLHTDSPQQLIKMIDGALHIQPSTPKTVLPTTRARVVGPTQ